jgi:epoxyqueuosine reductase
LISLTSHSKTIKEFAYELGFDLCRIVPLGEAIHADFFEAWLNQGHAGEMTYLARNVDKRRQPVLLAEPTSPPLRSIIVLAVNYHQLDLPATVRNDPSRGLIATYAGAADYHELIRPRLYELDALIRANSGRQTLGKGLVDSGPVLERDWAHMAGIGFTGKNCCTIHPQEGSWLLLATLMVPEELAYDPPPQRVAGDEPTSDALIQGIAQNAHSGSWIFPEADNPSPAAPRQRTLATCGRCTRCLTACPTQAFVGPYHLDPQRCISYWTIEAKQPIPRALRPFFGNHIFGCDICQDVCPWNQRLPARTPRLAGLQATAEQFAPLLLDGFAPAQPYWLDQTAFAARFRNSPVKRAKRSGMLRNVCVALGNWADPVAIDALTRALADPDPLPRGHAAWALGQIYARQQAPAAHQALHAALQTESAAWVREEITLALTA